MRLHKALRQKHDEPAPAEWLVVGLGNPGEGYARNRHNIGGWAVNELARRAAVELKAEGRSIRTAIAPLAGVRTALVRPRTYVNESGRAVVQALRSSDAKAEHAIVIYDELDLEVGAVRLRFGGGAGGHNGLKDIINQIGPDFVRVRLGIGRPLDNGEPTWEPDLIAAYVLSEPVGQEGSTLEETANYAADAVEAILTEGVEVASSRFNRRGPGPNLDQAGV